ncbi:MAG: hypothetical protein HOA84_00245 [Candidatus Jacksonbacteria bacterium]|jgi:hypothetical protein|nr:hypothetical protein [Candidatus Jacksonbacteria bacterium]MBT6756765.1 hypothetical protein [Candidatus Jacksonbacteria bacterium]
MTKKQTFIVLKLGIGIIVVLIVMIGPAVLQAATAQAQETASPTRIDNPLGTTSPYQVIGNAIRFILGFVGILALINFIISGLQFLLSGGNAEKTKTAKQRMLWTVIGMAVLLASGIMVNFVLDILGQVTASGS